LAAVMRDISAALAAEMGVPVSDVRIGPVDFGSDSPDCPGWVEARRVAALAAERAAGRTRTATEGDSL
jgi:hypothetical protein